MSTLAPLVALIGWLVAWPAAYSSLAARARALIKKDEADGKKSVTEQYYWLQAGPSAFGAVAKVISWAGDARLRRMLMETVRRAPVALLGCLWATAIISAFLELSALATYEAILDGLLRYGTGQTTDAGEVVTVQTVSASVTRYIMLSVLTISIDVAEGMLAERFGHRVKQELRIDILRAVFSAPASALDRFDAGELKRISESGPEAVLYLAKLPGTLINCVIMMAGGLIAMLRADWRLCAAVLLLRLPAMINLDDSARKVEVLHVRLDQEYNDSVRGQVHDTISQLRMVQIATAEAAEASSYQKALMESLHCREIMTTATAAMWMISPLIRTGTDVAWLFVGAFRVLSGGLTLSAFQAFRGYRNAVTGNLHHVQWIMKHVEREAETTVPFFALLDAHAERLVKQKAADTAEDAAAAAAAAATPASTAAAAAGAGTVPASSESSAAPGFSSPRGAGARSKPLPAAAPPILARTEAEALSGAPAPLSLSRAPSEPVARPTLALSRSGSSGTSSGTDLPVDSSSASGAAVSAPPSSEPAAVPIMPLHLARASSSDSAASGVSAATGLSSASSLTHISPSLMRALSSPTRPAAGPRGLVRQPSRQLRMRMRGDIELGNVWFKYADRGKAVTEGSAAAASSKAGAPAAAAASAASAGTSEGSVAPAEASGKAADPLADFILKGVTCSFPAGSVTALCGASGGGKTSILRLLLAVYDANPPPAGHETEPSYVRIDGRDVSQWRLFDLRRQVAYIDQEATLLNRSIRENLQLGLPDDEQPSEAEMIRACKAAHIYDTIAAFPDGLDTKVGDRGVKLSSGERQRIAIARAFLRDPAVVLADEITANLDAISELKVKDGLHELMKGRTVITVAHRLSMAMLADQILVCEGGRIVEAGTVDELLAPGSGSRFAHLVECQALT